MTCFGPVAREHGEPVFCAEWGRRVFAMNLAAGGPGPIDAARHASERMDPLLYLTVSYYERWLAGMEARAKEVGVLSEEEIASGVSTTKPPAGDPPPNAEIIEAIVRGGMASSPQHRVAPTTIRRRRSDPWEDYLDPVATGVE